MAAPNLYFESHNPSASTTILMLHGAGSSHHEWDYVVESPHLQDYHILVPDLPSHGASSSRTIPLVLPDTAALLADLISKHAKGGKAAVVALSMGGYTAVYLAAMYPQLIEDQGLFLSGCGRAWPAKNGWKSWIFGLVGFIANYITCHLPGPALRSLARKQEMTFPPGLIANARAAINYRLGQSCMRVLGEDWNEWFDKVQKRTCIVAGVIDDGVETCAERGRQLRRANVESRAYKIPGMRHAWNLQRPDLFAKGIRSWFQQEKMPDEYELLD